MKEISPEHRETYHQIFRNDTGNKLQKAIRWYLHPRHPQAIEWAYRLSGASITNKAVNALGRFVIKTRRGKRQELEKMLTHYWIGEKTLNHYLNYIFHSTTFNEVVHAFVTVYGIVPFLPELAELAANPDMGFIGYAIFHLINAQLVIIQRFNRSGLLLKIIREMEENPEKFGGKLSSFYNLFAVDLPEEWLSDEYIDTFVAALEAAEDVDNSDSS